MNLFFSFFVVSLQFRMDGHSFVSALLCALIGANTYVSKPMFVHSISLPSSALSSSLLDSLSPASSVVENQHQKQQQPPVPPAPPQSSLSSSSSSHQQQKQQHTEKSSSTSNKNRANNNGGGNNANSNSIPMLKSKQICKISEWKCPNGTCIPLSRYCNGIPDCNDKSDEPIGCNGKPTFYISIPLPLHTSFCSHI